MADKLYKFKADGLSEPVEVVRFDGVEEISRFFRFDITVASTDPNVAFDDVIGQAGQLSMQIGKEPRHVHGIVLAVAQGEIGKRHTYYHITLVPELWKAHKKQDIRIFQNKSTKDILNEVLSPHCTGACVLQLSLQGSYEAREYCVQYRESDWDFASRLMEEDGIYCYFEHTDGKHTLVIADSPSGYADIPGDSSIRFHASAGALAQTEHVFELKYRQAIRPDKVTLRDYNFKQPSLDLQSDAEGGATFGIEVYDYPGDYLEPGVGSGLATRRLEQWQVAAKLTSGASCVVRFCPGHKYTLEEHPRGDFNAGYMFLRVEHRGTQPTMTEGSSDEDVNYSNRFISIPDAVPYRPPQRTPKPKIYGVQTAIVTGPAGEEIHTDEHGRIKAQFHWDRMGQKDENSSCWMRVRQLWSGPGWGGLWIPRIGQEVIVEFLEGDPDRPLVAGTVYHGANVPPYPLPDHKTVSTVKSNSSIGGDGFNEFRFQDQKGSEEIFLHGQKDWTIKILNDKNQEVDHDETLKVGHDRDKEVDNNQSEQIGRDKKITVGKNHTESIGGNESITIDGKERLSVSGNRDVEVGGKHNEAVSKDQSRTIGGNYTQDIAKDASVTIKGNQKVAVKKSMQLTVDKDQQVIIKGEAKEEVEKEKTIIVGKKILIECGDAKVTIEKSGKIGIEGKDISVKAKGDLKVEGKKLDIKSKGAVNLKASGKIKVKGSKVGVN